MNIWIDKCVKSLKKGNLASIKQSISADVMECYSIDEVKDILDEWIADIEAIKEAMND